jgi:hypothetical protein
VRERLPVDADGTPIPWLTYPFLAFLEPRLKAEMNVFEYGSGNSTLWWASRVRQVVSCEHNRKWYEQLQGRIPSNVELRYAVLDATSNYSEEVLNCQVAFDIVIIDGMDRENCSKNAPAALSKESVIIFDNSDRASYDKAYKNLSKIGFKRLDFHGPGPINHYGWCTSIFYRNDNCFGI